MPRKTVKDMLILDCDNLIYIINNDNRYYFSKEAVSFIEGLRNKKRKEALLKISWRRQVAEHIAETNFGDSQSLNLGNYNNPAFTCLNSIHYGI